MTQGSCLSWIAVKCHLNHSVCLYLLIAVLLNHHLPTDLGSLVTAQSHNVLNCKCSTGNTLLYDSNVESVLTRINKIGRTSRKYWMYMKSWIPVWEWTMPWHDICDLQEVPTKTYHLLLPEGLASRLQLIIEYLFMCTTENWPNRYQSSCFLCSVSDSVRYCDCFANGEFCSNCNCVNCSNNMDHEKERSKAIKVCASIYLNPILQSHTEPTILHSTLGSTDATNIK